MGTNTVAPFFQFLVPRKIAIGSTDSFLWLVEHVDQPIANFSP